MSRNARVPVPATTLDQDSTLVVVLELSARSWLVGARVPGIGRMSRYAWLHRPIWRLGLILPRRVRARQAGRSCAWCWPMKRDGTGSGWPATWKRAGWRSTSSSHRGALSGWPGSR